MIDHMDDMNAQQAAPHDTESDAGLKDLQDKLQACYTDVEQWKDKCSRVSADFQNFKRRTDKEQALWMRNAQSDLILAILPIMDDLDRALAQAQQKEHTLDLQTWLQGFEMIRASLYKTLQKFGVQEITDVASFNPELHEAIASVDAPGKQPGDIVQVLQKGYMFKGELLRPAQVAVAK